ncbi:hypothetical protein BKA61DRAFT_682513 [Leptodontidium sp. MPI-SDFR-AT-0119]|nr:hypothetical protein BKA61DRAFT_682513 [Leptodontidium sp. MPI-SDFR-AT-0119]
MADQKPTLEWFGATTFRLKAKGMTVFLDSWLERPAPLKSYLTIGQVTECDYILISHAHFDHLPGADRLAKNTGAIIIGNGEAIAVMRKAGVPDAQLVAVAGGERIPLFTKAQRDEAVQMAAAADASAVSAGPRHGPPKGTRGPPVPDEKLAKLVIHAWPSLHCLGLPVPHADIPQTIDTATVYTGALSTYSCTLDLTRALTYGFGNLIKASEHPPWLSDEMKVFIAYMKDRETNQYSFYDGGQIMYNILIDDQTLLWNGHLGAYEGILRNIQPRPNVAVLGIAGRGNLNGRPFDGSAAEFAVQEVKWLGEPSKLVWCLHDEGAINPKFIKTDAATKLVEKETKTKVIALEHNTVWNIFN